MLIPQVHIIQKQSPREIMKSFNSWSMIRSKHVSSLDLSADAKEDSLGIPAETHVQWDQGMQHYIMTVVYLATEEEIKSAEKSGIKY